MNESSSATTNHEPNHKKEGGGEVSEELMEVEFCSSSKQVDNEDLPIELQYYEVDMNDPKMDPLEWTVRKVVPIPKAYYWDTENKDLPLKTKAWHRSIHILETTVKSMEKAGEVVANMFGLNSSRYSYVLDTMTPEERELARRINEERRERSQNRQAAKEVASDIGVKPDVI